MKLVQKQFLKGSREFEIVDDAVKVRLKSSLSEEKLSVSLAVLNPDPVVNAPFLEFHSRVKCGPLLSLLLDKPNPADFNAFVDELKRRARDEYHAFAGLKGAPKMDAAAPHDNQDSARRLSKPVSPARIDEAVEMLEQYLEGSEIDALLGALNALKVEPESESRMSELINAFDELGPRQGAVLTYAPYIGILLTEDPFEF